MVSTYLHNRTITVCLIWIVLLFVSCEKKNSSNYQSQTNDPVFLHRIMKSITDRMVHDIFSPPVASRVYAYSSIAAYEAVRHQNKNHKTFVGILNGLDSLPQPDVTLEYSFPLASVQAMIKVGRTLIFSEDVFDKETENIYLQFKNSGMPTEVYERSISFGNQVAEGILAWSSKDNYKQSRSFPKYSLKKDPATWKPTPPAYMDAVEPHWNKIRPFVIDSTAQFKPIPPTLFSTTNTSQFYKEAYAVFESGNNLTSEQKSIASFWDCNPFAMNVRGHVMFASKKISPGGHWINITRLACNQSKFSMVQCADAYTKVSLVLADAFISCWDEKYRSQLVRPESYINQYINEDWVPLLQTPPFPEYPSGHSVVSSAASVILTKIFGENYAYVDSTEVEFGMPVRNFTSFYQASEEAGISRFYGGIHYMPAIEEGAKQGKTLGEFVIQKLTRN